MGDGNIWDFRQRRGCGERLVMNLLCRAQRARLRAVGNGRVKMVVLRGASLRFVYLLIHLLFLVRYTLKEGYSKERRACCFSCNIAIL